LGQFRDPAIARDAMDLVLKPDYDLRESVGLLLGPLSAAATRALPFEFVKKNYDAIAARIPAGSTFGLGAFLPMVGGSFCDEKSRAEVEAFFEPKVDRFPGTRRNLAQVLESIRICSAYKDAQQSSVAEFFRKY
jgi:alanyl aminopeptidase